MPDAPAPDRQLVPPADLDAEAAVLSTLLLYPERLDEVPFLEPMHFYAVPNAHVFNAIRQIDADGGAVDIVTVAGLLRDRDLLHTVGGPPYLAQLSDATPAVAHIEPHARRIVSQYDRRRIITECRRIAAETYGDIGDVDAWKQEVDSRIQAVTQSSDVDKRLVLIGDATRDVIKIVQQRKLQKGVILVGATTGLPTLDARIGGLEPGKKYVFAARPGMGKTALLTCILLAIAKRGDGVVMVSIEMPREQIVMRFLSQLSRIDSVKIQRGQLTDEEMNDLVEAAKKLAELPIAIEDSSNHTPSSLRAAYRQGRRKLRDKHGKKLKVVALGIDYLQLMGSETRAQNREAEISAVSRATKAMAKSEGIAVLELAQVNRDCEKRPGDDKRPQLSDLRESGSIEQDADMVSFLYRHDVYKKESEEKDDKAEIIVRKLRDNGGPGTVHCEFHPTTMTFFEKSRRPDLEQLGDVFDDFIPGTYDESPPEDWHSQYDK